MKITSDDLADVSEDLLGRDILSKEIAKGLEIYCKKHKDGITLSITGEWGSGKSTLLNYLKTQLDSLTGIPFKIIPFNPWMFYKNESIRQAFLLDLALALKDFETERIKVSKKIKDLVKAFAWVKEISAIGGKVQQGVAEIAEYFSESESVSDIKNDIEKILRKSKRKIVVLIDDIDRLMPDQIMELFQTISLVTDFSNIVYVLAFDKKIVVDSINKFFSGEGEDYLEKIIQIDYEIPKIMDEKIEDIFLSKIKEVESDLKIKFDNYALDSLWDYHGMKHYFKNIRDFKRFFNALSFRLPIIADEINVTDFLVVEAIRIFDYKAYDNLYSFYMLNLRKKELSNTILTNAQFDHFSSPTIDLLKAIFPDSSIQSLRNEANLKRLHDPNYFERYFSLGKSNRDISEKDLKEIIQRPSVRTGILKEAANYNRIENLITRLDNRNLLKHYPKYDIKLITDLIAFFNNNPSIFEKHSTKIGNMIINLLFITPKKDDIIKSFFMTFGVTYSPVSIVHIYFFYWIRQLTKQKQYFRSDLISFDQYYRKHYSYIENIYLPIFKSALNTTISKSFTQSSPFIKYLYQINFAQLFPDEYVQYFNAVVKDDDYVLYLAEKCMWLDDKEHTLVRYEVDRNLDIYPNTLFIELYSTVKRINDAILSERQRVVKQYFLALDISNYPKIKYPNFDIAETQ